MYVMYTPTVSIPNPDAPLDMPMYEGDLTEVRLVPGDYLAYCDDTEVVGEDEGAVHEMIVRVTETESWWVCLNCGSFLNACNCDIPGCICHHPND